MTKNEVIAKIKEIIEREMELKDEKKEILSTLAPDSDLLSSLGMTSIDTLQILTCVEQEFDIFIEDDELTMDLIRCLNNLGDFVLVKMENA